MNLDYNKFGDLLSTSGISIYNSPDDAFSIPFFFNTHPDDVNSEQPLWVVLHAMRSNTQPLKARYKGWNLFKPFDCYGYMNEGSYWLGKYPDCFLVDSLVSIVEDMRKKKLFNGEVYISGASSAGYACVFLAKKLNAKALYLNIPILSADTPYKSDHASYKRYSEVFGENSNLELNAADLLDPDMNTLFYIVDQRYGYKNFLKNNSFQFVNRCVELGLNFKYEVQPTIGHSSLYSMKHIQNFFESLPQENSVVSTGFPDLAINEGIEFDNVTIAS